MNIFKHNKSYKVYEGRFITDDEIKNMIKPHKKSFMSDELKELNDMLKDMKYLIE